MNTRSVGNGALTAKVRFPNLRIVDSGRVLPRRFHEEVDPTQLGPTRVRSRKRALRREAATSQFKSPSLNQSAWDAWVY